MTDSTVRTRERSAPSHGDWSDIAFAVRLVNRDDVPRRVTVTVGHESRPHQDPTDLGPVGELLRRADHDLGAGERREFGVSGPTTAGVDSYGLTARVGGNQTSVGGYEHDSAPAVGAARRAAADFTVSDGDTVRLRVSVADGVPTAEVQD
jgi:hypothetical protein